MRTICSTNKLCNTSITQVLKVLNGMVDSVNSIEETADVLIDSLNIEINN